MAPDPPLLSIVVPTRNEAANIRPLGDRLRAALSDVPFEVCFVDDSDDGTPSEIAALDLAPGEVRCLARDEVQRQGGLSTAVVAGVHMARGTWVCVMDADLQHPPEAIPTLLEAGEQGADLVIASRYMPGGSSEGLSGAGRRAVSRAATGLARILFYDARRSSDPLSGFFLCRRAVLDGIEFRPVGFKILLELLVCVRGLRVVDVPVTQAARAHGMSKASARQGLVYVRHLWSLFMDVPGSARRWKFAIVGASGTGVLILVLWLLTAFAHLNALLAFIPAFALSLSWNGALNWLWTFADQRRRGTGARRYLDWALVSGLLMFGVYALLVLSAGLADVLAALAAAATAMLVNGVVNRGNVAVGPTVWTRVALDLGVQAWLNRLAAEIGADHTYVLPPGRGTGTGLTPALVGATLASWHPVLLVEAPSYRAQPRTNVELMSRLIVPVVDGGELIAVLVCERLSSQPFKPAALDTAVRAVGDLAAPIAAALRVPLEDGVHSGQRRRAASGFGA